MSPDRKYKRRLSVAPILGAIITAQLALMIPYARAQDFVEPNRIGQTPTQPPDWMADAIWYQVFLARFANGDASNDPPGTLAWTHDWARLMDGERPPLRQNLFFRRYGGDLVGLRKRLDHIQELGANTLYLNPVFSARSEHKYDTADHRHIDDTFGVKDSRLRLGPETEDPATWGFSESDRLFLDLLADAHSRGMRVVLDGVFNHVGQEFWAWQDVLKKGRDSRYAHWFAVTDWGPPLQWKAWDGPNGHLVEFRQSEDGLEPEVEQYLFAVLRRWMDPDGDGDPADGVDGWRLDAAEKVPHGFWRRFRREVKRINPDAAILGEIWTDATPWVSGDQFDAVTNYPFSAQVIEFLNRDASYSRATRFVDRLGELKRRHDWATTCAMANLLGSHDTPRSVTMLYDAALHPVVVQASRRVSSADTLHPGDEAFRRLGLAALLQYTWVGAPMIYHGDEFGMYGGNDPFCRAPMWWPEHSPPELQSDLQRFYRTLGRLRNERIELRRGSCRVLLADDSRRVLAFARTLNGQETIVVVNASYKAIDAVINLSDQSNDANYRRFSISGRFEWRSVQGDESAPSGNRLRLALEGLDACVILTRGQGDSVSFHESDR